MEFYYENNKHWTKIVIVSAIKIVIARATKINYYGHRATKINYYRSVRSESIIITLFKIVIARAIKIVIMVPCDQNRYLSVQSKNKLLLSCTIRTFIIPYDHNYYRSNKNCYRHVR